MESSPQIQALSDLYAKDLDLLRQWGREDAEAYEDLAQQLQTLNETAQETLGNCTNQEALAPVLDGYCADAAKLLLTDVDFTSGTTTLRQLEDAADRLERTRKALDGLSEDQRKLFGEESIAVLESAETLLAVYRKAGQTLRVGRRRIRRLTRSWPPPWIGAGRVSWRLWTPAPIRTARPGAEPLLRQDRRPAHRPDRRPVSGAYGGVLGRSAPGCAPGPGLL